MNRDDANALLLRSVQRLLRRRASVGLRNLAQRTHPADLAFVAARLPRAERAQFFDLIAPIARAAQALSELAPAPLAELLSDLDDDRLASLIEAMDPDDAADTLEHVTDLERRDKLFALMRGRETEAARALLEHDRESAGGLMSPEFFALEQSCTARQALERLQDESERYEVVFYLYVHNEAEQLVGVVSLRDLVLAHPEATLESFMGREVVRVQSETDQEEVARLIARYNFIALPVVDANHRLIGVITVDDIIDVIRLEATEDMLLMAGAPEPQNSLHRARPGAAMRARAPWLLPPLAAGFAALTALILAAPNASTLALIPLAMACAGGAATQSGTVAARRPVADLIAPGAPRRILGAELLVGAGLALLYGAIVALGLALIAASVPAGAPPIAAAGAIAAAIFAANLAGALLPIAFARLGLDTALATGPLAAALIDALAAGLVALWTAAL